MDERSDGKQKMRSYTWTPPAGMRPSSAEKEAQKQAILFEEKVRQGMVSFAGTTRFEDYANAWLKNSQRAFKTKERYASLLKRINPAIGHIKLEKLQAHHLEEFYRTLAEDGAKKKGANAASTKLNGVMAQRKISREKLAKKAGVAPSTVSAAARGKHISIAKAEQICAALELPVKEAFTCTERTGGLADKTIHHHHQLIGTILAKAKRERIIPFNVALEHAAAPKVAYKEAKFLTDDEARQLLRILQQHDDIRVKTALMLALFTGVRRGELGGLSWPDIDFENQCVKVRRASQYQRGNGIVEVATKNVKSMRDIDIPPFMVSVLKEYKHWWVEHRLLYGNAWNGKEERLFIQDDGKPISPDTLNYWLTKVLKKNDLPHISLHSLRHTFATLQIAAGVDIRTLQARTGHSQASTLVNV